MNTKSDLALRLDDLHERLSRLEDVVHGLVMRSTPTSEGASPPPSDAAPFVRSPAKSRAFRDVSRSGDPSTLEPAAPAAWTPPPLSPAQQRAVRAYPGWSSTGAPAGTPVAHAADGAPGRPALEQFIGMRAFAYAGALVVVFAIALFLKLAYEEGWLRQLDPGMRCLSAASLGVIFLVGAELARRRLGLIAASGLNLAGLGCIYASAYAASAMFNLLTPLQSLLALAITAVLGIVVGVRARLPLVSILAGVAGYVAPFLLNDTLSHPMAVPVYLGAMLLASLVVASTRPSAYRPLRHIAAAGTMIAGAVWAREQPPEALVHVLVFLGVKWAVLHADAARYSLRNERRDVLSPLLIALTSTAWAVTVGLGAIYDSVAPVWIADHWHWPAFLGALSLAIAIPLGRFADALRDPLRDARARLANVCWLQAVTLAAIAIGLAFQDWPREASWIGLGLALAVSARLFRSRMFEVLALGVLLVSAGAAMFEAGLGRHGRLWEALGFGLDRYDLLALINAAALVGIALIARAQHRASRIIGVIAAWSALPVVAITIAMADIQRLHPNMATAWIILAAIVAGGHHAIPRLHLRSAALAFLPVVLFGWMSEVEPGMWSTWTAPLFFHAALWSAMALSIVGAFISWGFLRDRARIEGPDASSQLGALLVGAVLSGGFGAALAFSVTSVEVARAASILTDDSLTRAAAVSVYWALLAVSLIALGFVRRLPYVRHVGLGLMATAAAKAIFVDATYTADWARVIAVLTVGLLMLAIALVYARLHALASRTV